MALEQYFREAVAQHDSSHQEDGASIENWKLGSDTIDGCEKSPCGGFYCNICLDFVQEPVVTFCGHLYCWPCIYKWIHFQTLSAENPDHQQPECPVCKAEISQTTLVPLYGRGQTAKFSEAKAQHLGIDVPPRPPSPTCVAHTLITTAITTSSRQYPQETQSYDPHPRSYPTAPMLGLDGTMTSDAFHPIVGMFGDSETLYAYPNSYQLAGSSSPRVRRHIMQADESLSRVCFFLCCCIVLCLILF